MTGHANLGAGGTVELASPGRRLGARVLDSVILAVPTIVLFVLFLVYVAVSIDETSEEVSDAESISVLAGLIGFSLLALLVGLAYEVTLIALKGQTVGKMATGIKVVRADNGMVPGWGKSFGRWGIPAAVFMVPFVGWLLWLLVYLSLLWDRARQGWHDKAASTLVIMA